MNNNENKKSSEELADEALDKVVGGDGIVSITAEVLYTCNGCGVKSKQSDIEAHNSCCPKCGKQLL